MNQKIETALSMSAFVLDTIIESTIKSRQMLKESFPRRRETMNTLEKGQFSIPDLSGIRFLGLFRVDSLLLYCLVFSQTLHKDSHL